VGMTVSYVSMPKENWIAVKGNPELAVEFLYDAWDRDDETSAWYLDKAWHAISFLIQGRNLLEDEFDPEDCVVGGLELDIDMGMGPARLFDEDLTKKLADQLSALSIEEFSDRFDPKLLSQNKIYPEFWDEDHEENLEYVAQYYTALRDGIIKASASKQIVISWLN
jgi:Domain of unknown function (DUF1877)